MKKLPCKYEHCKDHRKHWCEPDTPRGVQMCEVADHVTEDDPVFCSLTCAALDGWIILYGRETPEEKEERQRKWREKQKKR